MAKYGGDIIEISYKHPTLGSGVVYPKSAEESTLDTGGFRKNDDANGISGDGVAIFTMNQIRWMFEAVVSIDFDIDEDMEALSDIASNSLEVEWTFTHISGVVWGGTGTIVGDFQPNANTATATLKCAGGGKLAKIG